MHRRRFRSLLEPLLQQQRGSGTVEGTAAVAVEAKAFGGGPAAGVLIHQRQGQLQMAGQPFAIAPAVLGLFGGLLLRIKGQADHQSRDPSLADQLAQLFKVGGVAATPQRPQGSHGEAEGVTAGQPDAFAAHIQGQNRPGHWLCQCRPRGVGIGR